MPTHIQTGIPKPSDGLTAQTSKSGSFQARRRRPRLRFIICLVMGLALATATLLFGIAWYFSSQLLDVRPNRPNYSLQVLGLHHATIELPRSEERRVGKESITR